MRVLVAGTPGVGKTTVASILSKALNVPHVDVASLLSAWGLLRPDRRRFTQEIVDVDLAVTRLRGYLPRSFVADTHVVSLFRGVGLDAVVVLRRDPRQLLAELTGRGWPEPKVYENAVAELLDVVYAESLDLSTYLVQVDVSNRTPHHTAHMLADCLPRLECPNDEVDWIERLGPDAHDMLLRYEAAVGTQP